MKQRTLFDEPQVERMVRYNVPYIRGPHTCWEWQEERIPAEPPPDPPLIACSNADGNSCDMTFSGSVEDATAAGWVGVEPDDWDGCEMWSHTGTCPDCAKKELAEYD